MNAALAWAGGAVAAIILLISVYSTLLFRALRNERIIGIAIAAMHVSLADELSPQRALLSAIADTLVAQEQATARIEVEVHELALRRHNARQPEALLRELSDLPEPQLLIADFLAEYGGAPGSGAMFTSIAGDLLQAATLQVFGDLADADLVQLERLLLLAGEGRIGPVAQAARDALQDAGPPPYRAPRVADLDGPATVAIARALDRTIRRQLRLITLLHGQAEAILCLRRNEHRGLAALWARLRRAGEFPLLRKPGFQSGDLSVLVTVFDAIGEVVGAAEERLAEGAPARAAQLLAGVQLPVPAGLPGRMYHQECLAQVRPLAALGVWHRLAVSRWAAEALRAAGRDQMNLPALSASLLGSPDAGAGDEGGDT